MIDESFHLLIQGVKDYAVIGLDGGGRVTHWNQGAEQLYGYPSGEAIGRPLTLLYPEEAARGGKAEQDLRIAAIEGKREGDAHRLRKDGSSFWACVLLTALRDPEGSLAGFCEISRDVTGRREREEALRANERLLSRIVRTSAEAILILDSDGRISFANRAAERLLGAAEGGLLQRGHDDPIWNLPVGTQAGAGKGFGFLRVSRTGEEVHDAEWTVGRPDGVPVTVSVHAVPLRAPSGAIEGVVVGMSDITERKRAQEEREARLRLEALSRRLVEVEEAERRRIARELHDEVGGALTGLALLLGRAAAPSLEAPARLEEARGLVRELIVRVRDLSQDLRPAILDDLGLLPALRWLARRFSEQTGVETRLEHADLESGFPPEIEAAAFRIAQEALTNVARHSRSSVAAVRVRGDASSLVLEVEDEGEGFDPEAVQEKSSSGLSGMRDRALSLGGRFTVRSCPGAGTCVSVEFPVIGE